VSAILVRARAADHVRARRPEEVGPALTYVVGAAAETLTALRRLVGVLRAAAEEREAGDRDAGDPGEAVVEPPQPTLADLPHLVDRVTGAGQAVSLRQTGDPRTAPADLQLTAYRVVQEALTNALRHAPGAVVTVELAWAPRSLGIRVGNGPGGPATVRRLGGGNGLVGMRERLAACGGSLATGRTPGGGWEVTAGIPLPPEAGEPAGTERSGAA
jgi:signal transduction histidine kinase